MCPSLCSEGSTQRCHSHLPATTQRQLWIRNMRTFTAQTSTQPTFSPRHLQHPNHPGIQSTSTQGFQMLPI